MIGKLLASARRAGSPHVRVCAAALWATIFPGILLLGCGGTSRTSGTTATTGQQTAAPIVSTAAALNGAVVVTLASTTPGAQIYYTVDGSVPTAASTLYQAPFLVSSNLTVKAIALAGADTASNVTSQAFNLNIPSGTLVWSDEFSNTTGANTQPDPATWTYYTGAGFNHEIAMLCSYNSNNSPCSPSTPNSYVGTDGYLHIIAQQPSPGVYTTALMWSQGLFSFQYGRIEARIMVPEEKGLHTTFWLLGNNGHWPACGEMDIMERINAAGLPLSGNPPPGTSDWNQGSIHGTGFTGGEIGTKYYFTGGVTAASWHTYGIVKTPNSIFYYVDDPTHPYVTYTPASLSGLTGAVWPFDNAAQSYYIILDINVGDTWAGPPNSSTKFPAQMLVDYVRIYAN